MLEKALDDAWRARRATADLDDAPAFADAGLVLGAGTVLASADDAEGGTIRLEGETRLLALLSVAYDRPIGAGALGHVRRAVSCWNAGEPALARTHVALAGLGRTPCPHDAARRLFLADQLIEAGAEPEVILRAAGLPSAAKSQRLRRYDGQPRVPSGNGVESGQFTYGRRFVPTVVKPGAQASGGLSITPVPDDATPSLFRLLAQLARRVTFPVLLLNTLMTPTKAGGDELVVNIPGHPNLRLVKEADETEWRVIDDDLKDNRTVIMEDGTLLRDRKGGAVGLFLPDGKMILDLNAVFPAYFRDDAPKFCPAPTPDKYGGGPDSLARAYENQVKALVNPENPTPDGMAVSLPNAFNASGVTIFDDCQRQSGVMVEAKGPGYGRLWRRSLRWDFVDIAADQFKQSGDELRAANGRPIVWFFADPDLADYARGFFDEAGDGRENIGVYVLPFGVKRR